MSLRIRGQFLVVGALGLIIANILQPIIQGPDGLSGPNAVPIDVLAAVSGVIAILGLSALTQTLGERDGLVARIGVVLLALGTLGAFVLGTAVQFLDITFRGSIPHDRPHGPPTFMIIMYVAAFVSYVFGGLIVGITLLRAQTAPAGIGWLLIIGAALVIPANVALSSNGLIGTLAQNVVVSLIFVAWAWAGALVQAERQGVVAR